MIHGIYRDTAQNQRLKQSIHTANHKPDHHSNQRDIDYEPDIAGLEQISNAVDSIIDGRHIIAPFTNVFKFDSMPFAHLRNVGMKKGSTQMDAAYY